MGKGGIFVRKLVIALIKCYQFAMSPFLGNNCRFYPGCSEYARIAIERFGLIRGIGMALYRLLRCHPWCQGGYDPVPKNSESKTA